jgi:lambda repressor-like predicted transcriptional regulator
MLFELHDPIMHPELIKAHIRMANSSLSTIAKQLKVTPNTVHMVIRGTGKSARVARKIASVTGQPIKTLWDKGQYDYIDARQKKAA